MHRWVLIISILVVIGLASVPFWSTVAICRTMVTFFTLLALAQMWNLLGGYAGLVSVGQQAYIGLGAYGLWLIGDVLGLSPFIAVFLAGGLAALVALPVAPLMFRLQGRVLRHRHVGGRRGAAPHRRQHRRHRRRLGQDGHLRRQAAADHAHPRHLLGGAVRGRRLHPARLVPAALAQRPGAHRHPRQRARGAELRRQRVPHQAVRVPARRRSAAASSAPWSP